MNGHAQIQADLEVAQREARRLFNARGERFPTYTMHSSMAAYSPEERAAYIVASAISRQSAAIERLAEKQSPPTQDTSGMAVLTVITFVGLVIVLIGLTRGWFW